MLFTIVVFVILPLFLNAAHIMEPPELLCRDGQVLWLPEKNGENNAIRFCVEPGAYVEHYQVHEVSPHGHRKGKVQLLCNQRSAELVDGDSSIHTMRADTKAVMMRASYEGKKRRWSFGETMLQVLEEDDHGYMCFIPITHMI